MSSSSSTRLRLMSALTEKASTSRPSLLPPPPSSSSPPPSSPSRRNKSDLSIIIINIPTYHVNVNNFNFFTLLFPASATCSENIESVFWIQYQKDKILQRIDQYPIRQNTRKSSLYPRIIKQMRNIRILILVLLLASVMKCEIPTAFDYLSNIDPSIILQPRYAIPKNFVGEVIDGYLRETVIITKSAGYALTNVQADLKKLGYSLVVYDAYRPQKGVNHFMRWSEQSEDYKTKAEFYPYLDKSRIIPDGYVATKSGHSRGSTVDLTIISLGQTIHEVKLFPYTLTDGTVITYRDDGTVFMGSHFDFFGNSSHHDTPLVPVQESEKRNLLRIIMQKHGFKPYSQEWWHYTLISEPFPDTYFDFDVV